MLSEFKFLLLVISYKAHGGITIPKEDCRFVKTCSICCSSCWILFVRWSGASDWDTELKCDGNQVAVGSCSGGGGFGHKDCPGGTVHQIKCCDMQNFYFSDCNTFNSDYGQPIDCRLESKY